MSAPDCDTCRRQMTGMDQIKRCRWNGLPTSAANADGCRHYEAEAGSDDTPQPWFAGAWCEGLVG
jgi:hypothetical protein